MNNPWDLKTNDNREADTVINFIIFCEDSVSEPIYFKYFETSKIKVNCIKDLGNMMKNVINAIHHCEETGLITHKDGEHCLIDGTKVWCVFDRDKEETAKKIAKGNISFNASIKTAEERGINVAWSNDCFELWVLLHFEDVELTDIDRPKYYERLTEIFKNLPNPNDELKKVLEHPEHFNYKKSFKRENNFRYIVRPEILPKTSLAIDRAKQLESNYNDGMQHHEKAPLTLVYKLVEELLEHGEKEI
tara:strand:+ start:937 stop:1677 length:741 start_codon:yes stop_codon:yes gene_type:complete